MSGIPIYTQDDMDAANRRYYAANEAREKAKRMDEKLTVREAARRRMPLDGADAQGLEGALAQAERQLATANQAREKAEMAHNHAMRLLKEAEKHAEKSEAASDEAQRKLCRAKKAWEDFSNDNIYFEGGDPESVNQAFSSSAPCPHAEREKALEDALKNLVDASPSMCTCAACIKARTVLTEGKQ